MIPVAKPFCEDLGRKKACPSSQVNLRGTDITLHVITKVDNDEHGQKAMPGRDILNKLRLFLDGLAHEIEVQA